MSKMSDLVQHVEEMFVSGCSNEEIVLAVGMSIDSIRRYRAEFEETYTAEPLDWTDSQ